jgi:hypothetical protein
MFTDIRRVFAALFPIFIGMTLVSTTGHTNTTAVKLPLTIPAFLYVPEGGVMVRIPIYVEYVEGFTVVACFSKYGYAVGGLKDRLSITEATCMFANSKAAFAARFKVFDPPVET